MTTTSTTSTAKPRLPAGLATRGSGARIWKQVNEKFDLRPDELRILEDAAREADLIDRMTTEMKGKSLTTLGSMGQIVIHPLVSEVRQHRSTLAALLMKLQLPEPVDLGAGGVTGTGGTGSAGERSSAARKMANARWAKRGTK